MVGVSKGDVGLGATRYVNRVLLICFVDTPKAIAGYKCMLLLQSARNNHASAAYRVFKQGSQAHSTHETPHACMLQYTTSACNYAANSDTNEDSLKMLLTQGPEAANTNQNYQGGITAIMQCIPERAPISACVAVPNLSQTVVPPAAACASTANHMLHVHNSVHAHHSLCQQVSHSNMPVW